MRLVRKAFSSNSFLSLLGNGSAAVLGFASFALLARSLSKEDLGQWILFLTIYIFIELVRVGFLQTPLVKFSAGADKEEKDKILGAGWIFAILLSSAFVLLSLLILWLGGPYISNMAVLLFLKWFWLLFMISLPFNFATWVLQAELKFDKILYIRLINLVSFISLVAANFYLKRGVDYIVYSYMISTFVTSLVSLAAGWSRIGLLLKGKLADAGKLFHFGKYSTGTMIGANLLRSSDTFLIGGMLGAEAVAMYSVPLKLFEIIEIPLRSFVATSLPAFSKMFNERDMPGLKSLFEKTAGTLSIALLPLVLFTFIFADQLVVLLGGEEYAASAGILRIFALLSAFMPMDRFTGVALDVFNKPQINTLKVFLMLVVNVAGDVLVLWMFGNVMSVAAVSIVTFVSGVLLGLYFIRKIIDVRISNILQSGYAGIKVLLLKFLRSGQASLKENA